MQTRTPAVTRRPGVRTIALVAWLAACGVCGTLLAPWIRLGGTNHSTLDLIGSARALGLLKGAPRLAVVIAWLLAPFGLAASTVALSLRRWRTAALCLACASATGFVAGAVSVARLDRLSAWGPTAAIVFGAIGAAASIALWTLSGPDVRCVVRSANRQK